MIANRDMYQKLAEKIINDIGYNINIIDKDGIIIASGIQQRIGCFHAAGQQAFLSGKRIDITKENIAQYTGADIGINQPFYHDGTIIGVIGITGQTKEILDFVHLVKSMIELMVEQEILKNKMFFRQRDKVYFALLLLNSKSDEDVVTLHRWAHSLGYQLNIPRAVIVVKMEDLSDSIPETLIYSLKKIERLNKENILVSIDSHTMVIFRAESSVHSSDRKDIHQYCCQVHTIIQRELGVTPHIGIGSVYADFAEYSHSYEEAEFALTYSKKISPVKPITSIEDCLFLYFLSKVPKKLFHHFVQEKFVCLQKQPELMETVVALAQCNLSVTQAAEVLHVHKNTIIYRMKKIEELTKINLQGPKADTLFAQFLAGYYYLS